MKTKPNLGGLRDQLASQLAAIAVAAPPPKAPPEEEAAPRSRIAAAPEIPPPASPPAKPQTHPAAGPARNGSTPAVEPTAPAAEVPTERAGQGSGAAVPAGLQVAREALANTSAAAVAAKARKPAPKTSAPPPPPPVTSVEVNARLFQEDLEQLTLIQDLMKRQTGRISIGMAAAIRVAIRAFQSDKPVMQIITEVNSQDGRGRWSR